MSSLYLYLTSTETHPFDFQRSNFAEFESSYPDIDLVFLQTEAELLSALPEIEWLDTWHFDESWYRKAPRLRGVFTPAAGRDWVAPDPRHVVPTHYGTFHGVMMAETLLGLVLHFSRRMPQMLGLQRQGQWDRSVQQSGTLLASQTALIIGYGNIGTHCGRALTNMGMEVWGHQRRERGGIDANTGVELIHHDDLETWLPQADHVIVLLPGGETTRRFMSRERLAMMKPGAIIYNLGRGTTIDEAALVDGLNAGRIGGAGLDVTEQEPPPASSPLWQHSQVVLLPHSSCIYREYPLLHVAELGRLWRKLFDNSAF